MKTTLILASILILATAGCDQHPNQRTSAEAERAPQKATTVATEHASETASGHKRFTVEFHGRFRAGFDNNVRDILLITDTQTGRSYIGITGVGVSELRTESHTSVTTDSEGHSNVQTTSETKER